MDIERSKLSDAISRVMPAIAKKELFEQATKIIFRDGYVAAYNDEISIFDYQPELQDLEGAVDGAHLHTLLNRMSSQTVTLETDGTKLNLRSGRVKASFDFTPVTLPIGEIDRSGDDSDILPDNFTRALGLIAGTCARDMSKPVLTCVYLNGETLTASDGFRAATIRIADANFPKMLLPGSAAEVLSTFAIERLAISDSGEWARFTSNRGTTIIHARTALGNFPNIDHLFDVKGPDITFPDNTTEVIARASIFSERQHRIDEELDITLKPNQIIIAASYDGGHFSEVIRTDQKIEASFTIHPDFLAEVLKTGTSCMVGSNRIKFTGAAWQHVIALRD